MLRTLIIDDIAIFRQTFKDALMVQFPSMIIEEAINGDTALSKIEEFQPNLIFMDIRLPGKNGIELTEIIKAKYPKIPIIILTNYDMPEYRDAAFLGGADGFITKGSLKMSAIKSIIMRQCT